MTNRWIFALVFLVFFQLIWFSTLSWNELKIDDIIERVESNNISIFSYQDSLLYDVGEEIEAVVNIIDKDFESGFDAEERMIQKYELQNVVFLDSTSILPSSLTLILDGNKVELENIPSIKKILLKYNDDVNVSFYENELLEDLLLRSDQQKITLYINWIFGILFSLISFISLGYMDVKNADYWRIYFRAGGKKNQRRKYNLKIQYRMFFVVSSISLVSLFLLKRFSFIHLDWNFVYPISALLIGFIIDKIWRRK